MTDIATSAETGADDGEMLSSDKSILKEARKRFALCVDAEDMEREASLDDLKFAFDIDGYQWPDAVRRARGQRPTHTNNRMLQFINHVVNEQRKSRPSITVSPVGNGANVKTAQVYQGLVRNIERTSRAEVAYDTAFMYAVACGRGFFRISTDYSDDESCDQDIKVELIDDPFAVYTDPDCHEPDGIDAKFRFVSIKMKRDAFEEKYGFEATSLDQVGKGDELEWFDEEDIRVAEYWRMVETEETIVMLSNGATVTGPLDKAETAQLAMMGITVQSSRQRCKRTVEQYLMTGDKIIEKSKWVGKYIPIITVCGGQVNVEGKKHKYSLIRYAKDAQRLDNYWASTEAEALTMQTKTPWVGARGQFDGHEAEWAKSNTSNQPYLEYEPVAGAPPPERQGFVGTPTGFREARMASQEDVKAIMGLWDASLGARSNETSGVAIRERKTQGDTATYHFIDAMAKAIESAGRIVIDLIPKVYDSARVVRIIKPDEQSEMVSINQIFIDPQSGQPYQYDLCTGTYDVAVKVGPSFQTQREEARQAMLEFMQVYPQSGPLIADLLATNMDWPNSTEVAQRLKALVPPQALGQPGPPDPMQAVEQAKAQQIQQKGQLDLQKKQMEIQASQMKHQMQAQSSQAEQQAKMMQAQIDAEAANDRRQEHAMEMQLKAQQQQIEMMMAQQKLILQRMEIDAREREAMRNDALYQQRMMQQPMPPHGPPQTQF